MFTYSLTTDTELIKSALLSSNNLPWAAEDGFSFEKWEPPIIDRIKYIANYLDGEFVGLIVLLTQPNDERIAEGHMAYLPKAYGYTDHLAKEAIKWVWNNTVYNKIIAPCILTNNLAKRVILKAGLRPVRILERGWLKDGIVHQMCMYQINRPKNL
jgi:RimJ/RimL family protein N-acetyltransferase